jgi:hypothetical protein
MTNQNGLLERELWLINALGDWVDEFRSLYGLNEASEIVFHVEGLRNIVLAKAATRLLDLRPQGTGEQAQG